MVPATTDSRSGSGLVADTIASSDWSRLPEDLLVSILGALHVVDAIRLGGVCVSWHAAYAAFRRLRLLSPRQPPCLLYASDAIAPDAAVLHCPSTGATLKIPFLLSSLTRQALLGSGHGWLVTADEASNLHLLNPVTGDHVALPPITALHHVKCGTDEQGEPAYLVYENLCSHEYSRSKRRFEIDREPTILEVEEARDYMYMRVAISASPSAGRACVVLLLHMPLGEISFVRIGDEQWTWVAPETGAGLPLPFFYTDVMYSDVDGLFYVLGYNAAIYTLDLRGPTPVAAEVLPNVPSWTIQTMYLVQTPAGDILQVWRDRDYFDVLTNAPVVLPSDDVDTDGDICRHPQHSKLVTIDVKLYKVDFQGQRLDMIKSLPDCVLFLGWNGAMCLPVKDFPDLKPDCVYLTDDLPDYVNLSKQNPREVGIWSMAEQSMLRLVDVSPVVYPWLNWPSPIWIKPSLF